MLNHLEKGKLYLQEGYLDAKREKSWVLLRPRLPIRSVFLVGDKEGYWFDILSSAHKPGDLGWIRARSAGWGQPGATPLSPPDLSSPEKSDYCILLEESELYQLEEVNPEDLPLYLHGRLVSPAFEKLLREFA